jgi:PAS domain S-box-containing protein
MPDRHSPIVVRGTEILSTDPVQQYRQKIARVTLDSMVQFVGLLDANGTVVEINKVALDAVGIALADVEGRPFWTTFWWQVSDAINDELKAMIARAAAGEFVRWDTEIYGRAGGRETIIIDASLMPVKNDNGTVVFICAEGRDITEKKAQEHEIAQKNAELQGLLDQVDGLRKAAENANRAKDEFLAMLGHELRNPLSPIVTALQLMKLQGPGESERARAVIERQVTHLTRLVDDLLDVSRIARGKVELKADLVEIAEVVAKAIEMASPLLEQRNHSLSVEVPRRGLLVDADITRLSQVISNLLTNAAKYTPTGGHITIRGEAIDSEVILRVRDTGIGITPDVLPHIFDLFVQERQAIDRAQGGLGIGLTIVRNLVERHGGTVEVESDGQGRGSEFTIRLPRATWAEQSESIAPALAMDRLAGPKAGAPRVLIVDDNEDGAEMLSIVLSQKGYDTRVAHDAPGALKIAEAFKPATAFIDIGLPVMDGYELAAKLRAMPSLAGMRLIALTGYGQEADRRRGREAGFDDHLVKPVDIGAVEAAAAYRG